MDPKNVIQVCFDKMTTMKYVPSNIKLLNGHTYIGKGIWCITFKLVVEGLENTKMCECHCGHDKGHCQMHLGPSMSYDDLSYLVPQFGIEGAHDHNIRE